jgi:hypothetical protein
MSNCFSTKIVWTAALIVLVWMPVQAETLRPFTTEDANTLPKGQVDISLAFQYQEGYVDPFTNPGLEGDRMEIPDFAVAAGVGDNVELQLNWPLVNIDNEINDNLGAGDPELAAKIRFIEEKDTIPAVGFRLGFKIPSASHDDGLGTNETDIYGTILATKHFGKIATHANIGLALLGNPDRNLNQDDVLTYGLALIGPITDNLTVGGEITGQTFSTKYNDRSLATVGLQYKVEDFVFYGAVGAGLNDRTENLNCQFGFTYQWKLTK